MSENTFTDEDGDIYRVERYGKGEYTLIEMYCNSKREIAFLASDAAKIIHLIAEAAAEKPVPQTRESNLPFVPTLVGHRDACYGRHELAPGVHQEVPHLHTEDMGQ